MKENTEMSKRKGFIKLAIGAFFVTFALGAFAACTEPMTGVGISTEETDVVYGQAVRFDVSGSVEDIQSGYTITCSKGYEVSVEDKDSFTITPKQEGRLEFYFDFKGAYYTYRSNVVVLHVTREEKSISTPQELFDAKDSNLRYVMTKDIDMSSVGNFTPSAFNAALDGNGFTIRNFFYLPLEVATGKNVGFFSENNGLIENVKFSNVDLGLFSEAASAGIVAGVNNGTIRNVTVEGKIEAEQTAQVGGIVGLNQGIVDSCENRATVVGKTYVGGLAGSSVSAINSSVNKGEVEGLDHAGGIVGTITAASSVQGNLNEGTIKGGAYVGGIIGSTGDSVTVNVNSCENLGQVNGASYVGGIIGAGKAAVVFDCLNDGVVSASSSYAGGMGGSILSARRCENHGDVKAEGKDLEATSGYYNVYVGGIAGYLKRIEECKNTRKISLEKAYGAYVGGLAGYLDGDNTSDVMNDNVNEGAVHTASTSQYVGGIVGYMKNATLRGAVNSGAVTGANYASGIAGYAESGAVYFCVNSGPIVGNNGYTQQICSWHTENVEIYGNEENGTTSIRMAVREDENV